MRISMREAMGVSLLLGMLVLGAAEARGGVTVIREVPAFDDASRPWLVFSARDQVRNFIDNAGKVSGAEVFHVVPIENAISRTTFEEWLTSLPTPVRRRTNFRLDDGIVRGRRDFTRYRLGPLSLSGEWPKGPCVVVDTGFFLPLYKDEIRTPMIPLVMRLAATLHQAGVTPAEVRIVDRKEAQDFPLEFGFLAGLLRDLFASPESFRENVPRSWSLLSEARHDVTLFQPEAAAERLEKILADPDPDPGIRYLAASLRFRNGDTGGGLEYLEKAVRADAGFARGYSEHAMRLWKDGRADEAETVLRAGRRVLPGDGRLAIHLALLLAERAASSKETDPALFRKLRSEALSLPIPEEVRAEIVGRTGDGTDSGSGR